jgi:hypothetical protein
MDAPITNPSWMEPMLPPEEGQRQLEDAAFDLVSRASSLAGQTNPIVTAQRLFCRASPPRLAA